MIKKFFSVPLGRWLTLCPNTATEVAAYYISVPPGLKNILHNNEIHHPKGKFFFQYVIQFR